MTYLLTSYLSYSYISPDEYRDENNSKVHKAICLVGSSFLFDGLVAITMLVMGILGATSVVPALGYIPSYCLLAGGGFILITNLILTCYLTHYYDKAEANGDRRYFLFFIIPTPSF